MLKEFFWRKNDIVIKKDHLKYKNIDTDYGAGVKRPGKQVIVKTLKRVYNMNN